MVWRACNKLVTTLVDEGKTHFKASIILSRSGGSSVEPEDDKRGDGWRHANALTAMLPAIA